MTFGPRTIGRFLAGEPILLGRIVELEVVLAPEPKEARFGWVYALDGGAGDRFTPATLVCRPEVGIGRNVLGVAGREVGVGIELIVLVVAVVLILLLPSERRDCGLRMPLVGI